MFFHTFKVTIAFEFFFLWGGGGCYPIVSRLTITCHILVLWYVYDPKFDFFPKLETLNLFFLYKVHTFNCIDFLLYTFIFIYSVYLPCNLLSLYVQYTLLPFSRVHVHCTCKTAMNSIIKIGRRKRNT